MALDSKYIIASDLQSYFVDKDTGAPLAAGVITFYKDQARTIPKNIYKLSGSPPNYSYVSLGNEITLSAVGTFQDPDTGDDIIPYYYPYDADGAAELYYVTCESEGGVLQFTREAWPNFIPEESLQTDFRNYIPNGQFLLHNNIPADITLDLVAGEIRQASTIIAPGGWTFERPPGSSAKDIVTFEAFGSYVNNPSASPKYAIRIVCEIPNAGDAYKDLRIRFNDVNKFADTAQEYTLALTGESNTGSNLSVSLIIIKYFGAAGSAATETVISNATIPSSFGIVQTPGFVFGDNSGKTIDPAGGDYVELALRFNGGIEFDVSLTDFILTPDAVVIESFPQTPDSKFASEAITPAIPDYAGMDLYLPVKLGPDGLIYDDAEVGDLIAETQTDTYVNYLHPTSNRMLANAGEYERDGYSPLGIPYRRLWNKYWVSGDGYPRYGTGANYLSVCFSDLAGNSQLLAFTNQPAGGFSNTADGSPATGFGFTTLYQGNDYLVKGLFLGANDFYIWSNLIGASFGTTGAGNSGFTVTSVINNSAQRSLVQVSTTVPTALASKYFQFGNTTIQYYVWFTVDGAGADPAPGGNGIRVNLFSTMTADDVATVVCGAISGFQCSLINCTSAASVPAGSYFSINTFATDYYVWYTKDGSGTDPAPADKTAIPVAILSADTAAQVASKTQVAINQKYFAVPDWRGLFPRGWDNGAGVDPDTDIRWSTNPFIYGDVVGTSQFYEFQAHTHAATQPGNFVNDGANENVYTAGPDGRIDPDTSYAGGAETRPINQTVNYVIKY